MKKIALIALAAASLGVMASPVAAQSYERRDHDGRYDSRHDGRHEGRYEGRHDAQGDRYDGRRDNMRWDYRHDWDRGFNINKMQNVLDHRIDRGIRTGRLTRGEARSLRTQFRNIAELEQRYRRGGLDRSERRDLERRLVVFEKRLDTNLRDGQYATYRR